MTFKCPPLPSALALTFKCLPFPFIPSSLRCLSSGIAVCTQALLPCGFRGHRSGQVTWYQCSLSCSALSHMPSIGALLSQVGRRHTDASLAIAICRSEPLLRPDGSPSFSAAHLTPSGALPPSSVMWFLHTAWSDLDLSRSQGGPLVLAAMVVL